MRIAVSTNSGNRYRLRGPLVETATFVGMKRSHFLKSMGGLSLFPWLSLEGKGQTPPPPSNCVLIPSETAGPFPLDLTENTFYFRQDIREDRVGVQLRQKIRIIGANGCQPLANVRVNIWHCDADGTYSGYGASVGTTFCRGYQITDENGECEFLTIVPGWYPGRVTHVHFQVFVSTQYSVISQWSWPHDAVVNAANAFPDLYPEGPDPMTVDQDGVFADGYDLQMANLVWDESAQEYQSEFEVTVEGGAVAGVGYEEMRTAQVMEIGEVYPNPSTGPVSVRVALKQAVQLEWELWNVAGRKVASRALGSLGPGERTLSLDPAALGCAAGAYVWQVRATASSGEHVLWRHVTVR